jgi:protein required for attachment to host cells
MLTARFVLSKWNSQEADFASQHVKATPEKAIVDQEQDILEVAHPMALGQVRKSLKKSLLTPEEISA